MGSVTYVQIVKAKTSSLAVGNSIINVKVSSELTEANQERMKNYMLSVAKDLQESDIGATMRGVIRNDSPDATSNMKLYMRNNNRTFGLVYWERNGGKYIAPINPRPKAPTIPTTTLIPYDYCKLLVNAARIELKISTTLSDDMRQRVKTFLESVGKNLQEDDLGDTYQGSLSSDVLLGLISNNDIKITMHDSGKNNYRDYFEHDGGKYDPTEG